MNFSDIGLSEDVLRAVADAGYTEPTPIQEQAIPVVLMGRDVLGMAQTGTGKTAGFTLPMIDILAAGRAKARMPRSLILEPTRELAMQVAENFEVYGKYHKLSKALLIGGVSIIEQQKVLDRGVDVLIATPGRLIDLFERGKILLSDVKILVIDEADRMLDMGFIPDIERIVKLLPVIRQTLFFSATFPPEIRKLADTFLMNPKEIKVSPPATTSELLDDYLVVVSAEPQRKRDALRRLLRSEDVRSALIFCNRKRDVDVLARSLKKHDFNATALHGDMVQSARTETLESFREGRIRLLVCSDVAARGLDIADMSHVFNFDVPTHAEDYVHRVGRTGRAGRRGRAFTLAMPEDGRFVDAIERLIGRKIERVESAGSGSSEKLESGNGDARRGRRRRGGRGGRGRSEHGDRAARGSAPQESRGSAPQESTGSAPQESRGSAPQESTGSAPQESRGSAPQEDTAPKDRPAAASQRQDVERNKPRSRRGGGSKPQHSPKPTERVRAFGESMPAFMSRPPDAGDKGG